MLGTVQKRQLGRKMQILHKLATCFLCKITDAPHTGARLETSDIPAPTGDRSAMPPTRGHDLKPGKCRADGDPHPMPPTRGHDLKHKLCIVCGSDPLMPPTRGHDLKQLVVPVPGPPDGDAPHTGARLETARDPDALLDLVDAPHTGARLETSTVNAPTARKMMPPTRGHDLKPESY